MSAPDISEREIELVSEVLRSGRLALGPSLTRFEEMVAERAGVTHGVAVSSGTAGLFLALKALGIGPGDEVITTPLSFIASASPILMAGATPVFVDVCPKSLNMLPSAVEKAITPSTAAIMGVEAFGNPAYMDEYARIANQHEIPLVEDCCEALGTVHKGRACGGFGRAGVFGFYPNKQITTGEGGLIVTNDDHLADLCRSLRNQGRATERDQAGGTPLGSWLTHQRLGYNFRLSEVAAAIGIGQMERFDEIVERRRRVAAWYTEALAGHPKLVLPTILPESQMTWFVYVVRLTTGYTREERDRVIRGLRVHDIGAADYFPCIHLQPAFADLGLGPGSFPTSESMSERTIALPFHGRMSKSDVDIVAQTLDLMLSREELRRT
ncbi:MAG: DegT/DnrJ/EryC1/StrS family aminotransferase [Planctomycetota bacterium]